MSNWHKNFTEPTPAEFLAELKSRPDLSGSLDIDRLVLWYSGDDYIIYHGDLIMDGYMEFDHVNVIVMGNVKAKVVDLSNEKAGGDEGGSFFVYGDVECDYFRNHHGKMTVISGSLKVNKILNAEFDDSCLKVHKDATTEYYHCPRTWINVKEKAQFKYGDGYCLPLTGAIYEDTDKAVTPDHSVEDSYDFLKIKNRMKKGDDLEEAVDIYMYEIFDEMKK